MATAIETLPAQRASRLDALLAARGLEAVWFARPDSFAWLTGGNNVVDRAGDVGVAAVGYDGSLTVVTNDIEGLRLAAEELPSHVDIETFPWHESSLAEAVAERSPTPAAADFPVDGFAPVNASSLRQPLTERDVEQYRELGREVATAVEAVCRDAAPDVTERAVAADLRGRLADRGIDTPVALVGGARRAQQYRHYTPTETELGDYALVSVTASRGGLYASCTRTVAFDAPPWLTERHAAATGVEATALAATRSVGRRGGTADEVFHAMQDAYTAVGFDGEWREHHQGGAAGFTGREWIATPDSTERVHLPMAYAWNPTVQGAKSEDTVLVTDDGVEPLTRTGDWPERAASAVGFDLTLPRPVVLQR
ncbi:M24 family metallopeptidase [Halorarius litoreus]|uniref:M24 family metallopeptidase n=1 Tax=Halorarius litoreus TaxID=2962676 RepID=UPI0020CC017F|nr:M24 family metallopeptidase [Halorarius litoreus]